MTLSGTHVGKFWLAGAPESAVLGRFTSGPDLTPAVEVFGELGPPTLQVIAQEPADDPVLTVHGDLFEVNERVTLVQASLVNSTRRYGSRVADPGRQRFEASFAVLGDYVDGVDQRFSSVRFRLQNLDEWASLPGFESPPGTAQGQQVAYRRSLPDAVDIQGGGQVGFEAEVRVSGPTAAGVTMSRSTFLQVTGVAGTWPELDRLIVTPMISLLTLAVGRRCSPIEVQVQGDDGRWHDVLGSWLSDEPVAVMSTHQMLVPYGVLTLEHLARWLQQVSRLGPLPPVVADSVAGSSRTLETEVLELTTVAEGLHRRLLDRRQFSKADAERVQQLASAAVAGLGEDLAKGVAQALSHFGELSYPVRIAELAAQAENCVPGVVGRANRWKHAVVESRNVFAHRSSVGFLSDSHFDHHLGVMTSLQWVLRIILLLQTGITAEVLGKRVEADGRYRLFLPQVRKWLPRVYA